MRNITVLPNRNEMLRRLKTVRNDRQIVERLYPVILDYADCEVSGEVVVALLQTAIYEFSMVQIAALSRVLQSRVDDYIKALIDDKAVRNDALTFLRESRKILATR